MNRIILSIFIALALAACGSSEGGRSRNTAELERTARAAGEADARHLLDACTSHGEIRDYLLEMRSKRYDISRRDGNSAAEAYEEGVANYLKESGDTLYRTLFQ